MVTVRLEFQLPVAAAITIEKTTEDSTLETQVEKGETIRTLLSRLVQQYPRFGQIVYDAGSGSVNETVSLFLNSRHIELLDGLETRLEDGDVLTFLPFISGG